MVVFQSAEDKRIGRFVGIVRGPSGTGKSSLIGSAYNAGHALLVGDIENKGWGKYPRFAPEQTDDFYAWEDLILDILEQPLESDGLAHFELGGHDMAIDTLGIDTLDRWQELAMMSLGKPGRDARNWWGKLLNLFKPFMEAVDYSLLNILIALHVQEKTPTIAANAKAERELLKEAEARSADPIDIQDLDVEDLGIGVYDFAANALSGALSRKIVEHMHFVINTVRTPDGESLLVTKDAKLNGVWYPAKDDFGLFQRKIIALDWHETEAIILGDPLGVCWDATQGRDRLIKQQAPVIIKETGTQPTEEEPIEESEDTSYLDDLEEDYKNGIQQFVKHYKINPKLALDVVVKHPLHTANTETELTETAVTVLRLLSNIVVKGRVKEVGLTPEQAMEVLAPMVDAILEAEDPQSIIRLTNEGLALLDIVEPGDFENEEEPEVAEELEDDDEEISLDDIPFE